MKKDEQSTADVDVTDEKYKGPSTPVVVAGHGSIEHLAFALIGLFGAGALAFVAPKQAAQLVNKAREVGMELKAVRVPTSEKKIFERFTAQAQRAWGGLLRGIFGDKEIADVLKKNTKGPNGAWFEAVSTDKALGFGSAFISHTFGMLPFVGKYVKAGLKNAAVKSSLEDESSRFANAITLGGLFGAIGYISGWGKALLLGGVQGNTGKHQFKRAQQQIKNLQEDNDDLNKVNDELHAKYVKAAARLDNIQAARENASHAATFASEVAAPSEAPMPSSAVQLDQNQHQGKMAESELSVA